MRIMELFLKEIAMSDLDEFITDAATSVYIALIIFGLVAFILFSYFGGRFPLLAPIGLASTAAGVVVLVLWMIFSSADTMF